MSSNRSRGHAVIDGLMAEGQWGTLERVNVGDVTTWTLAETLLPGGWRVVTHFNIVRFSPAWGMTGTPHHFETLVTSTQAEIGNSEATWASEAEAIEGHAVIVSRLRTSLEAA